MIIAIHGGVEPQWTADKEHVSLKRLTQMTKRMVELYVKDKSEARGRRR